MRGVRQQGLHVAIKERAKSTIFTQYLSHEDTKDLMKMGSNMEDWWRRSKKNPDDVIVKFIKSNTTQKTISLQASVVVNRDHPFAKEEFSGLYEMNGRDTLSAMPKQFTYIIWQETAPCHKGRGCMSRFWANSQCAHTILFPNERVSSLSAVLSGMQRGVSVRAVSMSSGKGEDMRTIMHVKSESIGNLKNNVS